MLRQFADSKKYISDVNTYFPHCTTVNLIESNLIYRAIPHSAIIKIKHLQNRRNNYDVIKTKSHEEEFWRIYRDNQIANRTVVINIILKQPTKCIIIITSTPTMQLNILQVIKLYIYILHYKAASHSKAKLTIIMSNKHECVWYLSF